MNKEKEMEVVQQGTDNVNKLAALSCCWPPGTLNMENPVSDESDSI